MNAIDLFPGDALLKTNTNFQRFSQIKRFHPDPRLPSPNLSRQFESAESKEINYRPLLNISSNSIGLKEGEKDFLTENQSRIKYLNPKYLFQNRKIAIMRQEEKAQKVKEEHK